MKSSGDQIDDGVDVTFCLEEKAIERLLSIEGL